MQPVAQTQARGAGLAVMVSCVLVAAAWPADAAGCPFEPQGEGRVAAVIDARTLSAAGRPRGPPRRHRAGRRHESRTATAALSAIDRGARRDLARRRRHARPLWPPARFRLSRRLRDAGARHACWRRARRWYRPTSPTRTAPRMLDAAEAAARRAKRGIWADPAAIKNAESPGDILAGIGRFTVVEGKVLSVRQAGATTYLNFGRNWTRDFAVTISRRMVGGVRGGRNRP